jgi:hypothetical protein
VRSLTSPHVLPGYRPPLTPGQPYHVWVDSFYTNLGLAQAERRDGRFLSGVLAENRTGAPDVVRYASLQNEGDYVWAIRADGLFVVTRWKDVSKSVMFLSACCAGLPADGDKQSVTLERRVKGEEEPRVLTAPPIAELYRQKMGSVDRNDQHLGYYRMHRRCVSLFFSYFFSSH